MIITDGIHLVATESEAELHAFAAQLGLERDWYQDGRHPHYDLTTRKALRRALDLGAKYMPSRSLYRRAWWAKEDTRGHA